MCAHRQFHAAPRDALVRLPTLVELLLCALVMCVQALSFAAAPWPSARLPETVHAFSMGPQMTVDGLEMRLQGFVSEVPPGVLLQQLRGTLGQPLVESAMGNKVVLGRAEQGGYYVTVQVESAGSGSKGVVAVTALGELSHSRDRRISDREHWATRLLSGSVITSHIVSAESGKSALYLVYTNAQPVRANRDALVQLLGADGYRLEHEGTDAHQRLDGAPRDMDGQTMYFTGTGREGMAVITRHGNSTAVVLNTVVTLRDFK